MLVLDLVGAAGATWAGRGVWRWAECLWVKDGILGLWGQRGFLSQAACCGGIPLAGVPQRSPPSRCGQLESQG